VLSKSVKYSLFDPTKEMAYIPLDDELKMKGKAAVDVVGSRLGKSGGAAIQFLLISITGFGINDLAGVFFVIFSVIIALWLYGVHALSIEFEKANKTSKAS
jgi:AAA family ATP:ADP antiporter